MTRWRSPLMGEGDVSLNHVALIWFQKKQRTPWNTTPKGQKWWHQWHLTLFFGLQKSEHNFCPYCKQLELFNDSYSSVAFCVSPPPFPPTSTQRPRPRHRAVCSLHHSIQTKHQRGLSSNEVGSPRDPTVGFKVPTPGILREIRG